MTLTEHSRLGTVAAVVGAALQRHAINAVLTGGACASMHTRGAYVSADMDFIVVGSTTQARLDAAMATVGFEAIQRWSTDEGFPDRFAEFLSEVNRAQRRKRGSR